MSLVELGTWFEHENDHILSKYLSHLVTVSPQGIDWSASLHSIMAGVLCCGFGTFLRVIMVNPLSTRNIKKYIKSNILH